MNELVDFRRAINPIGRVVMLRISNYLGHNNMPKDVYYLSREFGIGRAIWKDLGNYIRGLEEKSLLKFIL